MKNLRAGIKKEEGFTLVELMIVISIIAILAVVLVPKVGDMKDSVRNQGITSNVNSVRAFLELKVNSRESASADEDDRILALLTSEFTGGNAIVNPITNGEGIALWGGTPNNASTNSIIVRNVGSYVGTYNIEGEDFYTRTDLQAYAGKIYIYVCTDGYIVYGKNVDKTSTDYQVIK